uniref:Epoxide hydrolase N-terminal domain-containing protein n=1 Tax=Palpitomonas bilix TaxID=652834 RepID=A0A7S3GIZ2_9EUKA
MTKFSCCLIVVVLTLLSLSSAVTIDSRFPLSRDGVRKEVVKYNEQEWNQLRSRLDLSRIPFAFDEDSWEYGASTKEVVALIKFWRESYSWKDTVNMLNTQREQYSAVVEDMKIHFEMWRPKSGLALTKVVPLFFFHGWPGSFLECGKVASLLTQEKSSPRLQYVVFCPSLPGYGLSDAPSKPFSIPDIARVMNTLAHEVLGLDRYVVQGGDWGSMVAWKMAEAEPSRVAGIHVNFFGQGPPPTLSATIAAGIGTMLGKDSWLLALGTKCMKETAAAVEEGKKIILSETGYMHIQATKPNTVAFGLNDSPAGLLAYIFEKMHAWSHHDGDVYKRFRPREIIDNVMIYWTQQNIGSSMRLYKDYLSNVVVGEKRNKVDVPFAGAVFPGELVRPPKCWAEYDFDVKKWTLMPSGGHFAAMEEPGLLADDIHAFVVDHVQLSSPKKQAKKHATVEL